jgi:hypothetical protein
MARKQQFEIGLQPWAAHQRRVDSLARRVVHSQPVRTGPLSGRAGQVVAWLSRRAVLMVDNDFSAVRQ